MDMQALRRVCAGAMTLPPARQAARFRCLSDYTIKRAHSEQACAAACQALVQDLGEVVRAVDAHALRL